jgi:hypothetical protein
MSTPALQPIIPSFRLRILSDEQLAQLRSATLEILASHCPEPLAEDKQAELGRTLEAAER